MIEPIASAGALVLATVILVALSGHKAIRQPVRVRIRRDRRR